MMTTTPLSPSALKKPFSSAITKGIEVLPVRVVRPSVMRSGADKDWTDRTNPTNDKRIDLRAGDIDSLRFWDVFQDFSGFSLCPRRCACPTIGRRRPGSVLT